ncbi:MAG: lacF8 [Acidimicrobiaceae bacterium]|nr:lacF8 [Acidimicrobiaceae bacterium]
MRLDGRPPPLGASSRRGEFGERSAPSSSWAHRRLQIRRIVLPALFLGPVVIYAIVFFAYPLIFGFVMSVENFGFAALVKGSGPFVGLGNYRDALKDPVTLMAIRNTAIFTVVSVALQAALGLAIAVLLNRKFLLSGFLRRLILVPWLIPLIATGTIFSLLFGAQDSLVNAVLQHLGFIDAPIQWLINFTPAMIALITVNIWAGLPFNVIVFYSGLQDVDPVLHEAAKTDGANAWQRFRLVTFPLLRPVTAIVLMLGIISTVKVFDLVIVMTDGGPNNATQLLSTWAYTESFTNFNFGQGAAIGNILLIVSMIVAVFYVKSVRRE